MDRNTTLILVFGVLGIAIGLISGCLGEWGYATWELVTLLIGVPFALIAFYFVGKKDDEKAGEELGKLE